MQAVRRQGREDHIAHWTGLIFTIGLHSVLAMHLIESQSAGLPSQARSGGEPVIEIVYIAPRGTPALPIHTSGYERPVKLPVVLPQAKNSGARPMPHPHLASALQAKPSQSPQTGDESSVQPIAAVTVDASEFQRELLEHISRYQRYPEHARQAGLQGAVLIRFRMNRDGMVLSAWIEHRSGADEFDGEALLTLWRAVPLPAIPEELPAQIEIALPISFELS